MARRRMFSLDIVDTDRFLDMPASTQALYFHMGMRADDDGFVASPKRVAAICGCGTDEIKLLVAKGFIIPFESGVILIRDWRQNNQIRPDRYTPTVFQEEKKLFADGMTSGLPNDIPNGNQTTYQRVPQYSIGKCSIVEDSIEDKADKPPRARFSPPSIVELTAYCKERGNKVDPQRFIDYYTANGWKVGKNQMKDWRAAVRTWERNDLDKPSKGKSAERDYTAPPGFDFL